MRLTDDRYSYEREHCELALRLLRYEARSCLIRACTGLTDDRIRKLYKTYLQGVAPQRRKRGKSPHEPALFTRNARAQLEASLLAGIFQSLALIDAAHANTRWQPSAAYVQRCCDAYDYYTHIVASEAGDNVRTASEPLFSFEHGWFLMQTLAGGLLQLRNCPECGALQLQDVLAASARPCPFCEHKSRPALALVPRRP
jgi:hypothetical protein